MGVSVSGTLTLLFLVFIGPLVYAGHYVYTKWVKKSSGEESSSSAVEKPEGEREQLSSQQYLFALIGYAIGTYIKETSVHDTFVKKKSDNLSICCTFV